MSDDEDFDIDDLEEEEEEIQDLSNRYEFFPGMNE